MLASLLHTAIVGPFDHGQVSGRARCGQFDEVASNSGRGKYGEVVHETSCYQAIQILQATLVERGQIRNSQAPIQVRKGPCARERHLAGGRARSANQIDAGHGKLGKKNLENSSSVVDPSPLVTSAKSAAVIGLDWRVYTISELRIPAGRGDHVSFFRILWVKTCLSIGRLFRA